MVGGSNYRFDTNSKLTSLLIQGNSFEYYDTSESKSTKQLRINVAPQNTLVTFKNNFFQNTVIRTSEVGSTVKCNIVNNEFYFTSPPEEPAIFCRPLGTLELTDGQAGWLIQGNEILLVKKAEQGKNGDEEEVDNTDAINNEPGQQTVSHTENSSDEVQSGENTAYAGQTVAIETVFDESNLNRAFDVHVVNNKISEFDIAFKISGTLERPNDAGVIYRDNYTDGRFLNSHNVLGPAIFWGFNYDREGRPYNTGDEVQDYGYMREACHYGIRSVIPGTYSERILTNEGFSNKDGTRANNAKYFQGDRVNPVADGSKVWLCIKEGTSAGSEPSAGEGDFTDGTVTWREYDNVTIKGRNLIQS